MSNSNQNNDNKNDKLKNYHFGGIQVFSLDKIEEEILNESLYLDVFAGSDLAFKSNIESLENILPKLLNLSLIKFDYSGNEYNFPKERQIGVIAQEVKTSFPELVKEDENGKLFVNYSQLSSIAIQGVKELTQIVLDNQKRIDQLESELKKLKN